MPVGFSNMHRSSFSGSRTGGRVETLRQNKRPVLRCHLAHRAASVNISGENKDASQTQAINYMNHARIMQRWWCVIQAYICPFHLICFNVIMHSVLFLFFFFLNTPLATGLIEIPEFNSYEVCPNTFVHRVYFFKMWHNVRKQVSTYFAGSR